MFLDGKEVTAPCAVQVRRVKVPHAERIAGAVFSNWNGVAGETTLDPLALLSITPGVKLVNEGSRKVLLFNSCLGDGVNKMPRAVDQNLALARSQANFKVSRLKMMDNALTVGLWFNSSTANGKLFGKDGFNTFGKSYKTISCSVVNGQLQAAPGQITGGKIKPDRWQHVVLTGDENAVLIYLNGELVAKGPGCSTLNTDSFDFCSQHPAMVDRFAIYNRVIAPGDVKYWFESEQPEVISGKH